MIYNFNIVVLTDIYKKMFLSNKYSQLGSEVSNNPKEALHQNKHYDERRSKSLTNSCPTRKLSSHVSTSRAESFTPCKSMYHLVILILLFLSA